MGSGAKGYILNGAQCVKGVDCKVGGEKGAIGNGLDGPPWPIWPIDNCQLAITNCRSSVFGLN